MAYGALGAGLGGLFAGVAQARQQRLENEQRQAELDLTRQQAADERAYRQAELAREGRLDTVTLGQAGYDPSGNRIPPPPIPKSLQQIIPNQSLYGQGKQLGPLPLPGSPEYAALAAEHYRQLASLYLQGDP